jgi:2-polyprenyl-6-hydroxyphenyl methylase/3-demethylubiquinone-9 3-methyltransferase
VGSFARFAETWLDKKGEMALLHAMNEVRIPFVLKYITPGQHGLDVGTGGGLVPLSLVPRGIKMEGLDQEQALIDVAVAAACHRQLSILYHCSSVENFVPTQQYDFITCFEVIEHVDDFKLVCNHLISWVKPGGWLFFSTINRTLSAYLGVIVGAEYILKWLPQRTHSFAQFIKPQELMQALDPCVCYSLRGMLFNPLDSNQFFLGESLSVNYIGAWRKP